MSEKIENFHQPKNETEIRLERLSSALGTVRERLSPEEMEKVKAVILYGSTARGEAKETSDLDLHIDIEPYDHEVFKKLVEILQTQFTDLDFSFSSKNIIEGGSMAKLLTAQKNPDKPAAWKFIYCRSEEEKTALDNILSEKQKQKGKH